MLGPEKHVSLEIVEDLCSGGQPLICGKFSVVLFLSNPMVLNNHIDSKDMT